MPSILSSNKNVLTLLPDPIPVSLPLNTLKSVKYPDYDLKSRHWANILAPADTDIISDAIKVQLVMEGGGAWSGKGAVFRHSDGSIDHSRNQAYIQTLIDAQTITHFGAKNKYRQRDLRASFYNDEPNLRAKHLGSQSMWTPQTVATEAELKTQRVRLHDLTQKTYPLIHDHWEEALQGYPNSLEVALFLDGLRNGVCAYYDGQRKNPRHTPNYPLTVEQWEVVTREQDKDMQAGDSIGYFSTPPFVNAHIHPLGLTPKKEDGRKVGDRPLIDPRSVNCETEKIYCPNTPWEEHLEMIHIAGRGGKISKEDLVSAFKNFFYRDQDLFLFCFYVPNKGYGYCRSLNFGARANPPLYDRLSRLACWVFRNKCYALHNTHHVDDHLFYFPNFLYADINTNPHNTMTTLLRWAAYLGIIFAEKKRKWLESIAVVTGILVNLDNFTLSITDNRKSNILADLRSFFDLKETTKHALEVLVGSLTFVSKVAPAIRPLLSRMIHSSTQATHAFLSTHPRLKWADVNSRQVTVPLDSLLQDDIRQLHYFLTGWTGTEPILDRDWHPTEKPYLSVATTGGDACQTGFSGVFGSKWFHGKWSPLELEAARREKTLSMPYLELLTQTIIVQTWAHEWKGKNILLSCDCLAVVNVINNGRSRDIRMSELVRTISLSAMKASCDIKAIWIPGDINEPADSLSRFSLSPTQLSIQYGLLPCNQVMPLGRPSPQSDDM
jgi:hypothetical protein